MSYRSRVGRCSGWCPRQPADAILGDPTHILWVGSPSNAHGRMNGASGMLFSLRCWKLRCVDCGLLFLMERFTLMERFSTCESRFHGVRLPRSLQIGTVHLALLWHWRPAYDLGFYTHISFCSLSVSF